MNAVGFSQKCPNNTKFGGNIQVITVPEFIKKITEKLRGIPPMKKAVSEGYPLLRAMQFTVAYGNIL